MIPGRPESLVPAGAADATGSDWRSQMRAAFRDPRDLLAWLDLDPAGFDLAAGTGFDFLVTRAFAARMRPGDPDDPLLRQVLPLADEEADVHGFGSDPVGDAASRAGPGILHKYRGRALLVATGACPIHCRYCFRREFDYAGDGLAASAIDRVAAWLARRPDISELILSGGDPLMLGDSKLRRLTDALRPIPHLRRLRIHSRVPVTLPARIGDGLERWLAGLPWQVVVVIHANHASEFDASVAAALTRLKARGANVFNQAVLLAGINDDAGALVELMETGFAAGAVPYYLHLLDRVAGSRRFEVGRAEALELMRVLRERLPGYLVPRLVRERAGAPYKLPVFQQIT